MTTSSIPNIAQGSLAAHFLLDVADTIDIDAIAKMSGGASERAPLKLRPESLPNYINFPVPPLVMALPDMEILGRTAKVRLKVYDYGVMAVRILLPYEGDWANFEATARSFRHSEELVRAARKLHETLLPQFSSAISKPHAKHLFEDHFVYTVNRFDAEVLGDDLLAKHSHSLAALLRAEAKPLAKQEIEETLRLHISYFTSDLCVVEWDTAFVYDSADSAEGIADILEFANSQLVELRAYDARLNAELDWIYANDPVKQSGLFSHHAANQRAQRLRLMLVDIRELVDRTNNELKITGDAFYARVYRNARTKLGLGEWERQIDDKLESVQLVYQFLTDKSANTRSEFMELIVILLIAVEVILSLLRH